MKLIELPGQHPEIRNAKRAFTPATHLRVFTIRHSCGALLEVDDEADLSYVHQYTACYQTLTFWLAVTCAHCGQDVYVERYNEPGNPLGAADRPSAATVDWNENVPMKARSRAYKKWESSKDRAFWEWFFSEPDLRRWALRRPRAARKLKARLLP